MNYLVIFYPFLGFGTYTINTLSFSLRIILRTFDANEWTVVGWKMLTFGNAKSHSDNLIGKFHWKKICLTKVKCLIFKTFERLAFNFLWYSTTWKSTENDVFFFFCHGQLLSKLNIWKRLKWNLFRICFSEQENKYLCRQQDVKHIW